MSTIKFDDFLEEERKNQSFEDGFQTQKAILERAS